MDHPFELKVMLHVKARNALKIPLNMQIQYECTYDKSTASTVAEEETSVEQELIDVNKEIIEKRCLF